jgi:hypothetical protein
VPDLLSIGDLVQKGTYHVHSRFRRAVNFIDGGHLVTLVSRGMDAGPVNIVMDGLDTWSVHSLVIEEGAVLIDGAAHAFSDERVYISAMRLRRCKADAFLISLGHLGAALIEHSPRESIAFLLDEGRLFDLRAGFERNLARHVWSCVRDILYWDRLRGVERLRGCGIGLTPSGDDFIAGFLIGLNVLELLGSNEWSTTRYRVLESARGGNPFTDALLYLAEEGRVTQSIKGLISSLDSSDAREIRRCAERLLHVGGTSGADTAAGFYMTVREGLARRLRRAPQPYVRSLTTCRFDVV